MANFRLVHMTDLHIAIPPHDTWEKMKWNSLQHLQASCADPLPLQALANFFFEHRAQTDLVLISGDVADDGEKRNLEAALSFIVTPAQTTGIKRTLDAERDGGPPFFIIPGNHDRFQNRRKPGGKAFDKTFGPYWKVGSNGIQSFSLPKDNPRLALIAADFCLRATSDATFPLGYLGQGCAYSGVVKALVEETTTIRAAHPNIGVVWISHFPPLLDLKESEKLVDARSLIEAAKKNAVRHVIAGHLHVTRSKTYDDVEIICTGTASSPNLGETHGFWIQKLDIKVDASGEVSITLSKFRYKHRYRQFVPCPCTDPRCPCPQRTNDLVKTSTLH